MSVRAASLSGRTAERESSRHSWGVARE